ncbi:MAG: hypothetical protein R3B99_13555 [Polyangiales bacterium]|nr:hypothetical protein [Myxococcales bacterium]MCB9601288.1 hypothetical protein [Sandaracinus sp.]
MDPKLLARLLAHLRATGYPAADLKALEAEVAKASARTSELERGLRRALFDEPLRASLEALGVDVNVGGLLDLASTFVERDFEVELVEADGRFVVFVTEGDKRFQVDDVAHELVKRHELLARHVDAKRARSNPNPGTKRTPAELDAMTAEELLTQGFAQTPPARKAADPVEASLDRDQMSADELLKAGWRQEPAKP